VGDDQSDTRKPRTVGELLTEMRLSTAAALLGAAIVAAGSVGPWVDTFLGSLGGLRGDGRITLGAAVVAVVALLAGGNTGVGRVIAGVAGLVALGTAGYDFIHIRHAAAGATLFGHRVADVGWGPIAVLGGGALMISALVADTPPLLRGTVTAGALAAVVAVIIVGARESTSHAGQVAQTVPTIPTVPSVPIPATVPTVPTTAATGAATTSGSTPAPPPAGASQSQVQAWCTQNESKIGGCGTPDNPAPGQTSSWVGYRPCDPNISATPSASCPFAENVFYEVGTSWMNGQWNTTQILPLNVYSPTTSQSYPLECELAVVKSVVSCINDSATSSQIAFPLAAILAYTQAEANAYAASHNLGP
jgi:hypothetical protein